MRCWIFSSLIHRGLDQHSDAVLSYVEAHLGSVRNVLALLNLKLIIHLLPVIGHGKDAVGTLEGRLEGGFVIEITLCLLMSKYGTDGMYG